MANLSIACTRSSNGPTSVACADFMLPFVMTGNNLPDRLGLGRETGDALFLLPPAMFVSGEPVALVCFPTHRLVVVTTSIPQHHFTCNLTATL